MNYDVKKLYLALVKYYNYTDKIDLHVLYDDMNSEELFDLNLDKSILPYGEEMYYKRSLIPYNYILFHSKINYGHISKEDALKISHYYERYYFKLLRVQNINDFSDLVDLKQNKSKKKSR